MTESRSPGPVPTHPSGNQKPIRTVQVITRLIRAGAQYTVLDTARHLDRKRFTMEVWCGPQTGVEGSLHREFESLGVPVLVIPHLVRQVSPLHDALALRELRARLSNRSFDLIHTHTSKAGILGRLAAHQAKATGVVHTIHGWNFHERQPRPVRELTVRVERQAARWCHRLVAVTERDIAKGLAHGIGFPDLYTVIHSGIEIGEFRNCPDEEVAAARASLGIPESAVVVGTVGRLTAQKDPRSFLEVAARVRAVHPQVIFIWVGDGTLRPEMERLIADGGLSPGVRILGIRDDIPKLLHCFDVFLLTSIYEGLARVLPEALAAGKPIVATRVDGTVDAVKPGESGFLAEPGDIPGLSDAVIRLVADPGLRHRFGTRGRELAGDRFSNREMTRRLETLYAELAAGPRDSL